MVQLRIVICVLTAICFSLPTIGQEVRDDFGRVVMTKYGEKIEYNTITAGSIEKSIAVATNKRTDYHATELSCEPRIFSLDIGDCIGKIDLIAMDTDHDGIDEIFGASSNLWYVLGFEEGIPHYSVLASGEPDYNNGYERISAIDTLDFNNDGYSDLWIGQEAGKLEIISGKDFTMITSIDLGTHDVSDIAFGNLLDNGGPLELSIIDIPSQQIHSYTLPDFTLFSTIEGNDVRQLAVGNVAGSVKDEIVLGNGKVYSIENGVGVSLWTGNISSTNGLVELANLDNDDWLEIVWAGSEINVADALNGASQFSIISSYDVDYYAQSLIIQDVNKDGLLDIIHGEDQWGYIVAKDGISNTDLWSIDNPEHGVTDITLGHFFQSDSISIAWGAGCTSTGPDYLFIHNAQSTLFQWKSTDMRGPYYALEYTNIIGDSLPELVSCSFESESGFGGGVVTVLDPLSGKIIWQKPIEDKLNSWEGVHALSIADFKNDGDLDIIVAADNVRDGAIWILDGDSSTLELEFEFDNNIDEFKGMDVLEINNELHLVLIDDEHIYLVNPQNQNIVWTSSSVGNSSYLPSNIKVGNVDSDPALEVVAAMGNIVIVDLETFQIWESSETLFTNLDLVNFDDDSSKLEIVAGDWNGRIIVYDGQSKELLFDAHVGQAAVDGVTYGPISNKKSKGFVFGSANKLNFMTRTGRINSTVQMVPNYHFGYLGKSDNLILKDGDSDGIPELFIGGKNGIYQFDSQCGECFFIEGLTQITFDDCSAENNGSITLTMSETSGLESYSWSNGKTTTEITNLMAGDYTVEVVDENCLWTDTLTVRRAELEAQAEVADVTCDDRMDGSVEVDILTGTSPYTYYWSNGLDSSFGDGLDTGEVTIIILDSLNCSDTLMLTVGSNSVETSIWSSSPTCHGLEDGYIEIWASGGEYPYTYNWNVGGESAFRYNLPGDSIYVVTVTDSKECQHIDSVYLSIPDSMIYEIHVMPDDAETNVSEGTASVEVIQGAPPFFVKWFDPFNQAGPTATNLGGGFVEFLISDANGCHVLDSVWIGYVGINDKSPSQWSAVDHDSYVIIEGRTESEIQFTIHDIAGRRIRQGRLPKGHISARIDKSVNTFGISILTLSDGHKTETIKLIR